MIASPYPIIYKGSMSMTQERLNELERLDSKVEKLTKARNMLKSDSASLSLGDTKVYISDIGIKDDLLEILETHLSYAQIEFEKA